MDFTSLCAEADHLGVRLEETELKLRIAPLLTNLRLCAKIAQQAELKSQTARRLREIGLHERASRAEEAVLKDRMDLMRHRELVLRTSDAIFRTTGPLLGRPEKR